MAIAGDQEGRGDLKAHSATVASTGQWELGHPPGPPSVCTTRVLPADCPAAGSSARGNFGDLVPHVGTESPESSPAARRKRQSAPEECRGISFNLLEEDEHVGRRLDGVVPVPAFVSIAPSEPPLVDPCRRTAAERPGR